MIRFLLTRGHRYTFKRVLKARQRPALQVINYDDLVRAQRLRPATYVFTDMDRLSPRELDVAGGLYLMIKNAGFRVLNNPATARQRFSLLRALHEAGLNDFNVYRAEELPVVMRFPVFVRKERGHGMPLSDLLHSREEVLRSIDRAVAGGISAEVIIVIEYAGEPVREGQYRKLAAFRIGGNIVPHFSVNDGQWLVKYGRMDPTIEDLYLEERRTLDENPYAEHLQKVFDVARIEYGRADFGFYEGRIQVFEINTNPDIPAPHEHPSATRMENVRVAWEKYLHSLHSIDSPPGPVVRFREISQDAGIAAVMNHEKSEHDPRLWNKKAMQREMEEQRVKVDRLEKQLTSVAEVAKYRAGTIIDFSSGGNAPLYTRDGWETPEPWGTWTSSPTASLKIPLAEAPRGDMPLKAHLRGLAPVRATVHVNGTPLGTWEISNTSFKQYSITIPAGVLAGGECHLAFAIANPRSPESLGISGDKRLLGLGFNRIILGKPEGPWRAVISTIFPEKPSCK